MTSDRPRYLVDLELGPGLFKFPICVEMFFEGNLATPVYIFEIQQGNALFRVSPIFTY